MRLYCRSSAISHTASIDISYHGIQTVVDYVSNILLSIRSGYDITGNTFFMCLVYQRIFYCPPHFFDDQLL